ncbi:WD40/YVTN/BNR-like repeat-containing protein [Lacinutrix jangbogonensis]|uniref:WD40/YVTN/BNR-like repeat-containing protein n=1 Tax=Lacinutrix jangbogonensis TaxID=1469557 RepID=UPI00053DE829|nr:oxidoreductase [Lacinutrix jangbogonensis]
MKNLIIVFCVLLSLFSCKKDEVKKEAIFIPRDVTEVEIGLLLRDSTLNVRALEVIKNQEAFFATSDGRLGNASINLVDNQLVSSVAPNILKNDTIPNNFRAIAVTNKAGFLLTIGSPALLYKSNDLGIELVYQENHEKAFYDAMDFWNDKEGIAIGDPTGDCLSIIITRDGGNTWTKLSCAILPKTKKDEAAFAASDTNIAIVGDETWVATGGGASRILYSPNKGETWEVFNTPIVQGDGPQGMYSLDFYDNKNGFAIGGDYTKAADSSANKIRTADGGRTWQLVAKNQSPGYRSCVQYIPGREAKELVAIGFKGIDYSNDAGDTWKHLSDEGFYTLRFVNDSVAYAAGNKRIAKLTFR